MMIDNKVKIYDNNDIMEIIRVQMISIMQNDYEYYKNYNIKLANEQYYVSPEDRDEPNTIYIVVKFLPAEITHNQNIIPITINAISEYNKIEACQRLLLEYAQYFNLKSDKGSKDFVYNQTYTTPQVMSNFSEVYYGFRNTFYMSGSFLLSYNSNPAEIYYIYEDELGDIQECMIDTITYVETVGFQLDSQPFFGTNNFSKSETRVATRTINFSVYLVDDPLCNKVLDIFSEQADIGTDFVFKIDFKNGRKLEKKFKLVNYSRNQDVGAMPIANLTFTN